MNIKLRIKKVIFYLTILSGIFWFGFNAAKVFTLGYMFEPENMGLKAFLNQAALKEFFYLIYPLISLSLTLFIFFVISFLANLFFGQKYNLKNEGWALMILIILLACLPFEFYLSLKDYQIAVEISKFPEANLDFILKLVKERFQELSYFPFVQIFLHLTIVYLIVFQPLRKKVLER